MNGIEYKIAKNKEALASVAQAGLQQIIAKQYDHKVRSLYPCQKDYENSDGILWQRGSFGLSGGTNKYFITLVS